MKRVLYTACEDGQSYLVTLQVDGKLVCEITGHIKMAPGEIKQGWCVKAMAARTAYELAEDYGLITDDVERFPEIPK